MWINETNELEAKIDRSGFMGKPEIGYRKSMDSIAGLGRHLSIAFLIHV